jgi:cobalt-zinc-cadmium efflux system outer membrane protein
VARVAAVTLGGVVLGAAPAASARAQTPIHREDAVAAAVSAGARLAVARADTLVAAAALIIARQWPNPVFGLAYSKSPPPYHFIFDVPFDWPSLRSARVGAARAGRLAAHYKYALERAGAALDADTTYTRAIAARAKAELSRRNALESDSLRRMVVARRDAGDASDLEVALGTVTAGQAANAAVADSLTYISLVLDLQIVMGVLSTTVQVVPVDSLTIVAGVVPVPDSALAVLLGVSRDVAMAVSGSPLQVAAAAAGAEAARLNVSAQRRGIFGSPSLLAGVESGDPDHPGMLPTFGVSIPIPIFNRNRGAVRQAQAEETRALAELSLAQVQSRAEIARARRELDIALGKVARDRQLVTAAERVASLSMTAYREGAASLPNVLEAQRNAREVLAQYIDDLADALIFAAELRVITITPTTAR